MSHCCHDHQPKTESFFRKIGFPLAIAILLSLSMVFAPLAHQNSWLWFSAISSLLVLIFSARSTYLGAWQSLKNKSATMDTLIALGTSVAWIYSLCVLLLPQFFTLQSHSYYFETTVFVISFINLGAWLEARAQKKTQLSLTRLLNLTPKMAAVLRSGEEVTVPIDTIQPGDLVRIRPGERIAVDGIIVFGESAVDQSMLTGEPIPVIKTVKDHVSAGTINTNGSFLVKTIRSGNETTLAEIIRLVKQAHQSKPAIAKLADKISAVFVPSVILIAIITFLIWYLATSQGLAFALSNAMSVLIIACPCALGLSVPLAVIAGIGIATDRGILIRTGHTLQTITQLTNLVLDKTGTLTNGKPSVEHVIAFEPYNEKDILQLAASIEVGSQHIFANILVQVAKLEEISMLPITQFNALHGLGVEAHCNHQHLLLGNTKLLETHQINILERAKIEFYAAQGQTPLLLAYDGKHIGVIIISDRLKPDAIKAVTALKQHFNVMMVTGDHQAVAQSIANDLGISDVFAETLPADKQKIIKELQAQDKCVGMIGDGINDAAALAQADVGFAMGNGTDIALENADVILLRGNLSSVNDARKIANATFRTIKQNLWGAFLYNGFAIPIAAGIFYPFTGWLLNPAIASIAMALSSLTVVLNSNRLRYTLRR